MYDAPVDLGFADQLKKVSGARARRALRRRDRGTVAVACAARALPRELGRRSRRRRDRVDHAAADQPVVRHGAEPRTRWWRPLATTRPRRHSRRSRPTGMRRTAPDRSRLPTVPPSPAATSSGGVRSTTVSSTARPPRPSPSVRRRRFRRRLPHRRADAVEVTFSADASVHDGRFANNPWLQELPKPLNKVTWDNVIVMSPRTAEKTRHRGAEDDQVPGRRSRR